MPNAVSRPVPSSASEDGSGTEGTGAPLTFRSKLVVPLVEVCRTNVPPVLSKPVSLKVPVPKTVSLVKGLKGFGPLPPIVSMTKESVLPPLVTVKRVVPSAVLSKLKSVRTTPGAFAKNAKSPIALFATSPVPAK